MATIVGSPAVEERPFDRLSGTPRAHAVDRWIFVFMAVWFIAIVLAGFIPDSLMKMEMVRAGQRPPFPAVLHVHAVLMGTFLLLLTGQAWLMATGRKAMHMQLGIGGVIVAALLVLVGAVLRLRTIDQTLASIGRRLGLEIRKVELANPLAAVDVDKPADHVLVTAILEGRA